MRTPAFAIGFYNRCAGTEIDLGFITGHTFHPAKRDGAVLPQTFDKSANTVITALESMLVSQVLIDSLTGKPQLQFVFNDLAEGRTPTATCRRLIRANVIRPDGRFVRF